MFRKASHWERHPSKRKREHTSGSPTDSLGTACGPGRPHHIDDVFLLLAPVWCVKDITALGVDAVLLLLTPLRDIAHRPMAGTADCILVAVRLLSRL